MGTGRRTIVAIEDNPADAELLRQHLRAIPTLQFDFVHIRDPGRAVTQLARGDADVTFLDYQLGRVTGLEVLRAIRESGDLRPVVILTGAGDESLAAACLRAGADDYLSKDGLNPEALRRAVENASARHLRRVAEAENRQLLTRLRAAKQALEKRNRRLAQLYQLAHQFVDNVSHEFRTPLTVIREFASIIRDGLVGAVSDSQREYLGIVIERVDDLAMMVDDLLDMSKLEAGLLRACRRPCRLPEILDHVRPTLERKSVAAKARLELNVPAELPEVFCDPEKAGRVIVNLVINALKVTREGGCVEVSARHDGQVGEVLVGVRDEGPGIAPENLESIFERFRQVEGAMPVEVKGFGLGLNIAAELSWLNLGDIRVESQVGQGSTFCFTLPEARPRCVVRHLIERLDRLGGAAQSIRLMQVMVAPDVEPSARAALGEFLLHQMRRRDLLFEGPTARWLIVSASDADHDPADAAARLTKALSETNRNRVGRALPEIQIHEEGCWDLSHEHECFLRHFESLLHGSEAVVG